MAFGFNNRQPQNAWTGARQGQNSPQARFNQPRQNAGAWGMRPPTRQGMQAPMRQGMQAPVRQGMQAPMRQGAQPQSAAQARQNASLPDNLPDGVQYQPLDERTLAEIRRVVPNHPALAAQEPAPPLPQIMPLSQNTTPDTPAAPVFPPVTEPPLPAGQRLADSLAGLIQNERNGALYYGNLAALARTAEQAEILRGISSRCKERGSSYDGLYRRYRPDGYEPAEEKIMGGGSFSQGLSLAISEENRALSELIRLYEHESDSELNRMLNIQIYKKINDLSFLHQIITEG